MTILIITHNQKEQTIACIKSIQKFYDIDNVSIVVIDNCSDDGTKEWLTKNENLAYGITEELEGMSQILNETINLFHIEDDLLILDPNCTITPGFLSNINEILNHEETIAIVEPLANTHNSEIQYTAILLKKAVLNIVGSFDENFVSWECSIKDYKLRVIEQGFQIAQALNLLHYNTYEKQDNENTYVKLLSKQVEIKNLENKWGKKQLETANLFDYITYIPSLIQHDLTEHTANKINNYCLNLKKNGKILIKFPVARLGEKPRHSYEDIFAAFYRNGLIIQSAQPTHFICETESVIGYSLIAEKKRDKRMLMISAENALLEYNIREIAEAYRNLGWEVFCKKTKDFHSGEINTIVQSGISKIFVLNNVGWITNKSNSEKSWWDQLGIPSYNYILDHPMYYDDTLSKAPNLGTMLCVDRNHVKYINRFYPNIKQAFFLPLGGDNKLDGIGKDWNERKIDVLYVGGYKGDLDITHLPDGSEHILTKLLQNMEWPTEYAIEQEMKDTKDTFNEIQLKNEILHYKDLDWYIMTFIRVEVIRALIKGGINVTVYGSNWEKFEYYNSPHFIHKGLVTQEECLKKMKESKIVLNVMPWFKAGTHDRVINAMLSGAVCLTDSSSYMEEVFYKNEDFISYDLKHLEQLPEIVRSILTTDTTEMRTKAYLKAKEKHRWMERISQLENLINI